MQIKKDPLYLVPKENGAERFNSVQKASCLKQKQKCK